MSNQPETGIPGRNTLAVHIRKLNPISSSWPLPDINPTLVSLASLVFAPIFLMLHLAELFWMAWIALIMNFLLDGFDGAIARKFKRESFQGWVIDSVFDRLSEAVIFILFGPFWIALFIINSGLTVYSIRFHRNMVMPVRVFFIIFYFIRVAF
ncbi:MAG: CDP-alcohol phosphatidyltransferase family protein [bacterium]|nr:CDP-alcohol phosphatidyltransferase family protein [bacterium]